MPDTLTVGLLRHGETTAGQVFLGSSDVILSKRGWQQMMRAVEQHGDWQHIVSSPLKRCAEFATHLAQRKSCSLTFDTRLQEWHFGAWEGRAAADILEDGPALEKFWQDPASCPPPGGETLADFRRRVLEGFIDCCQSLHGRNLIISHGGVIKVLLYHLRRGQYADLFSIPVAHAALETVCITPALMAALKRAA